MAASLENGEMHEEKCKVISHLPLKHSKLIFVISV